MCNRVVDQHASRGFYSDGLKHTTKVANYANVEQLDALFGLDLKTSSTSFKDWTLNLHSSNMQGYTLHGVRCSQD